MSTKPRDELGLVAHWKCVIACILVSVSSFQYGLDYALISGFQAMIPFLQTFGYPDPLSPVGWNLSPVVQQLISSLMILGCFASSLSAGFTAAYVGRKISLWFGCALVIVAAIIMQTTTTIGGLYAGRLIVGLGIGLLMTHSQLYIQECAPAKYRGLALSVFMFWISSGTLIGTIVDNFTSYIPNRNAYLIPLDIIYIAPGLLTIGLIFVPESPRWLYYMGEHEKAEKCLRKLRPAEWPVDEEISEIQIALKAEQELSASVSFLDLFRNPIDRRRTFIAVAATALQGAPGSFFIIAYSTYLFEMAEVGNPFANTCIVTAVAVFAVLVQGLLMTHFGRRRVFLLLGFTVCGIMMLIIAAVWTAQPNTESSAKVVIALLVIYILFFSGCISTFATLSGGEIPSQRLRSYTFGIANGVGFLVAWLTAFTTPYFINPDVLNWGPKYGYIWFASCAVSLAWIYFYMPEVKGRTLEEIDELFEAKVPARKFRRYQCSTTHAARAQLEQSRLSEGSSVIREDVEITEKIAGLEGSFTPAPIVAGLGKRS